MDTHIENAPYDLLARWIRRVESGRALELGAGEGEVSAWLSKLGFNVDAVEHDPESFKRLKEAVDGLTVRCFQADLKEFQLEPETYSLITAFAVLHFLRPTDLWAVADQLVTSLIPGGVIMCEIFTTEDPEFAALKLGDVERVEPNTFRLPSRETVIHYFEPGELTRVFSELEILEAEEYRRVDVESEYGFRAGAAFVGRKVGNR